MAAPNQIEPGMAFLAAKQNESREHLWVVLTKPNPGDDRVLVVNVTTRRSHSETTTILPAGCHKFINKESVVYYSDARLVAARQIEALTRNRDIVVQPPVSAEVLAAIQSGVLKSTKIAGFYQSYFRKAVKAGLA